MTNTTLLYTIPADILRATLAFASTDIIRAPINTVHFAPAAGDIVATCGHTIVRLAWAPTPGTVKPGDAPLAFSLGVKDVTTACKAAGKGGRIEIAAVPHEESANTYELACYTRKGTEPTRIRARAVDTKFPSYNQVIPAIAEVAKGAKADKFTGQMPAPMVSGHCLNPNYLVRLADLANATADRRNGGTGDGHPRAELVSCADDMAPIRYQVGAHTVVIMPMRK